MPDRDDRSHIRGDGSAKVSFETQEEAMKIADNLWYLTGKPHNTYRCSQNPEHYHVGGGTPDLKPANWPPVRG